MRERRIYFVVVLLLFFNGDILGQIFPIWDHNLKTLRRERLRATYFMNEFGFIGQRDVHVLNDTKKIENNRLGLALSQGLPVFTTSIMETSAIKATNHFPGFVSSANYQQDILRPLTASFYVSHLGFFCKQELRLEKITTLPIRLRLGSLPYVNYLEQKPNYRGPL